MKRTLIGAFALTTLLAMTPQAFAQDLASSIVGVWKMASFTRTEVASGKSAGAAYGDHPTAYAHYTRGGNYSIFLTGQHRKTNEKTEPTDSERVELFKSMFAFGGTFKSDGDKIAHKVDIAWLQSWVGSTRNYKAQIDGNKLTLTTPPFKGVDGQDVVVVGVYERIE